METIHARPVLLVSVFLASLVFAQDPPPNDAVRVNMTVNADGSRTTYRFDPPHHQATAITTEPDGKPRGKVEYVLDEAGRFARSVSLAPDGKFRLKSTYRYDGAGRLEQETQLSKDDQVLNRIVYSYDSSGKQTGYAIFDGAGKLLGQTTTPTPSPPGRAKKK
jgi:hypothetical protein